MSAGPHPLFVEARRVLLVAKVLKVRDRAAAQGRNHEIAKDALDVLRLLRGTRSADVAAVLRALTSSERTDTPVGRATGDVVREALDYLRLEFARGPGLGPRLAARAAVGAEDPDVVAASLAVLTRELLGELEP